ncbi:MAG: class II aldolase/adducin family protein [Thermodesulfobacteriota bacterium]|nr:class II aldolase/adducin family protein [Thermodesulfobacteriota bacterium]
MMETKHNNRNHDSLSKEKFCRFCHLLYERHLVTGSGGNMAMRVGEGIYLTPSGYCLRDMEPDMVVTVSSDGLLLDGDNPSIEAGMHIGVLRNRPDINVVCHVHGAYIIAASTMLYSSPNSLPPLTPGFVYHAYPLPMVPFIASGTKLLAETVTRELSRKKCRAVLLQNHGLVTVGKSLGEAFNAAEEIDDAARIYVLTNGKAQSISSEEVAGIG